ncbi:hypothetical protein CASFOL_000551 [Castilleja foliolosa]|uniref:Mitochondrial carrier protein n=1 Tax=Castilleja foliolosa TaxID=1961234 RepID=A0ABD3EK19_9LAMI
MEREGEAAAAESKRRSKNTVMNPLLKGCLTGEYHALLTFLNHTFYDYLEQALHQYSQGSCKFHDFNFLAANTRMLKQNLICGVTYTPLSLGLFEILSNKVRSTNGGRPLSLYQEACCGLTCGGAGAFVFRPFALASSRITAQKQNYTYTNLFTNLHSIVRGKGVLALWRGSGLYTSSLMTANVGMFVSYNRSRDYLFESRGLSKWDAILSASIISGFFAAACSHPCMYLKLIKDDVVKKYVGGEKQSYRIIPFLVTRVLTPHSGFKFYVGFANHFRRWAAFCLVQWWIYEQIGIEE